jgi:hypothetical protein
MMEDKRLASLARLSNDIIRTNRSLRQALADLRERTDLMAAQATSGMCYPQRNIDGTMYNDPTHDAHRVASMAMRQNAMVEAFHTTARTLTGAPDYEIQATVAYLCERAPEVLFQI